MEKFVAFNLYGRNAHGACVTRVLPDGEEKYVYLASDVDALTKLLDKLAYPERFPESGCAGWHSGDGPFEQWANRIAEEYRALMGSGVRK